MIKFTANLETSTAICMGIPTCTSCTLLLSICRSLVQSGGKPLFPHFPNIPQTTSENWTQIKLGKTPCEIDHRLPEGFGSGTQRLAVCTADERLLLAGRHCVSLVIPPHSLIPLGQWHQVDGQQMSTPTAAETNQNPLQVKPTPLKETAVIQ